MSSTDRRFDTGQPVWQRQLPMTAALNLTARLHVDLQRVSSAVCRMAGSGQ